MSEQPEVAEHPVVKQRRKKRTRHTTPRAKPDHAPDELAGLTETECCEGCRPDRCVISGINVCAHPMKSGLQPALANDRDRLARYERARKKLAHRKIDLRGQ